MAIQILYRYKINEDVKEDRMQIANIDLSKNWRDFDRIQDSLLPFVRSKTNPTAYLDYEMYKPITKEVINSSSDYTKIPEILTRNELLTMTRDQLSVVAKGYSIDPVNKRDDFLIKLICKKQEERIQLRVLENAVNWSSKSITLP